MLYNTLGKRTNYKPNMPWGLDELTSSRQLERGTEGGVLFARKGDGDEKASARQLVLNIFHQRMKSRLQMLTMPGVNWKFERKLFGIREGDWMNKPNPQRTYFITAENNRAIFSASLHKIPGMHRSIIKETKPKPFAEIGFKSSFASHYFCNVDDLMAYDKWREGKFTAAWLDYTGPLNTERLDIIKRFYDRHLRRGILIVTALKARWNMATVNAIDNAGGYFEWLQQHLDGDVLHNIEYMDTSPMAQFAVARRAV